jgi:hypothetical protein
MHHIVSDGLSMAVLLNETRVLYEAFTAGLASPLPELPIQYVDYADWQSRWLASPACQQQLAYWRAHLAAAPDLLQLPSDRPRPAAQTSRGGTHRFAIAADLRDRLLAHGRAEGATPFVTLLAAYAALLHRLSGQEDVLVGSPIANRRRAETQDLIGFFVNTLVLRTDLAGSPDFGELLRRVNRVALDAYDHQDLPFDQLVNELQPERRLSQTPLFQVAFALQNVPLPAWSLAGLELSPVRIESGTSLSDLTLYLKESPEGLDGWFEYAADLFDAATVARFAGSFETLLAGMAAWPGRRLSEIPLLTPAGIEIYNLYAWRPRTAVPTAMPVAKPARETGPVRRHEILRTAFVSGEEEVFQVVTPPEPASGWLLPGIDLSGLGEARERELLRIAAGEVGRPFDLSRGPLLRSLLVRLEGLRHALLLVMHHIVSDGWSMSLLVRETVAAYRALARHRAPSPGGSARPRPRGWEPSPGTRPRRSSWPCSAASALCSNATPGTPTWWWALPSRTARAPRSSL